MAPNTVAEDLHRYLWESKSVSGWLSKKHRETFLKRDTVKQLIDSFDHEHPQYTSDEIADEIDKTGRRLLATLLLIPYAEAIFDFRKERALNDSQLPMGIDRLVKIFPNDKKHLAQIFFELQFGVIGYTLEPGHHIPAPQTIFPYFQEKLLPGGQNGQVYELLVPIECVDLTRSDASETLRMEKNTKRKRIPDLDEMTKFIQMVRKEFNEPPNFAELELHKRCRHECIAPLFTSYELKGKMNLILPWYEMSLEVFTSTPEIVDTWSENDCISALWGLSDAISVLHDPARNGIRGQWVVCHADLKPNNILVDEHSKRFILIDFGRAQKWEGLDVITAKLPTRYDDYSAPPWDLLDQPDVKMPLTMHDTWPLVCIITDLVIFMNNPSSSTVQNFRQKRQRESRFKKEPSGLRYPYYDISKDADNSSNLILNRGVRDSLSYVVEHAKNTGLQAAATLLLDFFEGVCTMGKDTQCSAPDSRMLSERLCLIKELGHLPLPSHMGIQVMETKAEESFHGKEIKTEAAIIPAQMEKFGHASQTQHAQTENLEPATQAHHYSFPNLNVTVPKISSELFRDMTNWLQDPICTWLHIIADPDDFSTMTVGICAHLASAIAEESLPLVALHIRKDYKLSTADFIEAMVHQISRFVKSSLPSTATNSSAIYLLASVCQQVRQPLYVFVHGFHWITHKEFDDNTIEQAFTVLDQHCREHPGSKVLIISDYHEKRLESERMVMLHKRHRMVEDTSRRIEITRLLFVPRDG